MFYSKLTYVFLFWYRIQAAYPLIYASKDCLPWLMFNAPSGWSFPPFSQLLMAALKLMVLGWIWRSLKTMDHKTKPSGQKTYTKPMTHVFVTTLLEYMSQNFQLVDRKLLQCHGNHGNFCLGISQPRQLQVFPDASPTRLRSHVRQKAGCFTSLHFHRIEHLWKIMFFFQYLDEWCDPTFLAYQFLISEP